MKNPIEEMLRKTNKFKEDDIEESAKFVMSFVKLGMNITNALPSYEQLNKALGIRRRNEMD